MAKSNLTMLNIKDIMEALGCGRNLALKIMSSSTFPAVKIGRSYYVEAEAFKRWWSANQGKAILM